MFIFAETIKELRTKLFSGTQVRSSRVPRKLKQNIGEVKREKCYEKNKISVHKSGMLL